MTTMPSCHAIRVDFDDGDHLYTRINGTMEEVIDHYFDNTFVREQVFAEPKDFVYGAGNGVDAHFKKSRTVETCREATVISFIVDREISHQCNRQLYETQKGVTL